MAYVPKNIEQENQNLGGPTGQTTNNPLNMLPPSAGGSVGAGGGAPNTGSASQFGAPASKLSDYLSANAPQVQAQGQKIANDATQAYQQAQGDMNTAAQNFGGQIAAGYASPNQQVVNEAVQNPTGFAKTPENVSAFQAQYNDQYQGPQNFESTTPYSNVQNEVNNAVQNANLLNTPAGLTSYLQSTAGPNYTQGMATLDASLLGGTPSTVQEIQQAVAPYANLSSYLANQTAAQDQAVANAQRAAQNAKQYAQNAMTGTGGAIPTLQNVLQNQLASANDAYQNAISRGTTLGAESTDIAQRLQNLESLTPQEAAVLGVNPDLALNTMATYFNQIIGEPNRWNAQNVGTILPYETQTDAPAISAMEKYFTPSNVNANLPTIQNTATADQYAQAQALATLAGQNLLTGFDPTQAGQAGTFLAQANNPTYDYSGLMNYLNSVQPVPLNIRIPSI